jgi:hypothetical protein
VGATIVELVIEGSGMVRCLYGEEIDLPELGRLQIQRASYVEPDLQGAWHADLSPIGGPTLGPFGRRTQALDAERSWLETHWLVQAAVDGRFPGHS